MLFEKWNVTYIRKKFRPIKQNFFFCEVLKRLKMFRNVMIWTIWVEKLCWFEQIPKKLVKKGFCPFDISAYSNINEKLIYYQKIVLSHLKQFILRHMKFFGV